MYSTRKNLHVKNFFPLRYLLMVLVSYIELLISADIAVEYVVPSMRNNISPAHQEVRDISHAPSQTRVASASLFVVRSTLTICSLYSSTAVRIRVGFSFQVRLPGLYDITPSPIVSRVRSYESAFLLRYGGLVHIPLPPTLLLVA